MRRAMLRIAFLFSAAAAFAQTQPTALLTVSDEATNPSSIGGSVAMSGSIVAAGAPATTVNGNSDQGAIDIFTKPASAPWTNMNESARLIDPKGGTNNGLGWAVVMSGDGKVIVASYFGGGCCVIFLEPAGGWHGTISPSGYLGVTPLPIPWINAGPPNSAALAMNSAGTMVVLGAPNFSYKAHISNGQHIPAVASLGAAYIWVEPSTGWSSDANGIAQAATVIDPGGLANDLFGTAVGIAANTVVVGAPGVGGTIGAAYVYQKPKSGWLPRASKPVAKFRATDSVGTDFFGSYVAVGDGGSLVAVSKGNGCNAVGATYVYSKPTSSGWPATMTQIAELTPYNNPGICFGKALAAVNGLVLVGGPLSGTSGGHYGPGADYSFVEPVTGWADMSIPISMAASGSTVLGSANAVGGRSVAVGGAATIYIYSN